MTPAVSLRKSVGFIDWIQTIQACYDYQPQASCEQERDHALEQWCRYTKEAHQPQARVWLMAAAMHGETMPPDLDKASLQVTADAPEYGALCAGASLSR